jgi:lipopolysaccharide transport system ATP-binding protein
LQKSTSNLGQGIAALSCCGVGKVFPVYDNGSSWRFFFGNPAGQKSVVALDNISLTVPKGKIVGVIGRNGSGKSTLLRVLGGNYTATSGRIFRNGDLTGLFELGGVGNPNLTGLEYAKRLLTLQGTKSAKLKSLIEDIWDFSELEADFERPIYTYSTGMAARLFFATATAMQYDIYLIDEALSVGDEHFQNKCWHRIRERLAMGASGVLVTHDWTAILRLCEEACILERGHMTEYGASEEIVRSYLKLSTPKFVEGAKFSPHLPQVWTTQAGQDAEFCFPVELTQPFSVAFAYSIEFLWVGVGWQILLLNTDIPVASTIGKHQVRLRIPRLPLAPGHYYLNIFLSAPPKVPGSSEPRVCYDARGWTYGNRLDLIVEGSPRASSAILPLTWKRVEIPR